MNKRAIIEQYHIVRCFSDVNDYMDGMDVVILEKNTLLYGRAEHRKYAYFLLKGHLQVTAMDENGREMLIRHCDQFIFLGDMELLGYSTMNNSTLLLTDCTFVTLDVSLLKDKLLADPVFLRFLCENLAEKINHFSKMQFFEKTITSRQKVASRILKIAGETGLYKENLRRTAQSLNISYRQLHRILSEMVEEGILVRESPGYLVPRLDSLEKYFWKHEQ